MSVSEWFARLIASQLNFSRKHKKKKFQTIREEFAASLGVMRLESRRVLNAAALAGRPPAGPSRGHRRQYGGCRHSISTARRVDDRRRWRSPEAERRRLPGQAATAPNDQRQRERGPRRLTVDQFNQSRNCRSRGAVRTIS